MPRFALFAYGASAYVLFLLIFSYFALFLLDLAVPKAINDLRPGANAAPPSLLLCLAANLGLIALFGVTHSVMARDGFKRALVRLFPPQAERSTFALQSSAFLAVAMWFWHPMTGVIWSVEGGAAVIFYAAFVLGAGILLLATFQIDHFELFGLRQIWCHLRRTEMPAPLFRTPFLYRLVRHPMQLGIVIMLFATPQMTAGHAMFAAAMTAYIFVGLYFEERALLREYGGRYAAYRAEVPMLIPGLRPLARARRRPAV